MSHVFAGEHIAHLHTREEAAEQHPRRLYQGHRRNSWVVEDVDEMVELRARSRTFDGAYTRTALGNLGYALLVLKLFTAEFARIGLIYAILAMLLMLIAQLRRRRSDHDFADSYRPADPSQGQLKASERLWGRAFRTSGDVVFLLGIVCTALYVAIFVLIMQLEA
ncbi:uncharacterized protein JCM10292_006529 [Rhodotorula paludigena]|uniref:uncharacterized protein n=1 Tax=Rhodotorula paludigena TaxID=86838 RepID=UPI003171D477